MKSATNPAIDYKALVRAGYDACASDYMGARASGPPDVDMLLERLLPGSSVLDLGCGSGVPVAKRLAERHSVTGVDSSKSQVALARANVPAATFLQADIATLDFSPGQFDAVVAYYVIFHLPKQEQLALLRSIWAWLKPGGYFMGTLSKWNEDPYTEDNFFGIEMFWTNFALGEYLGCLEQLGFEVLESGSVTHGFDDSRPPEQHPRVFAQKPHPDA